METPRFRPAPAPPDGERLALMERLGLAQDASALRLERLGPAPCSRACPAGINVKRYVALVAEGRHEEALAVVRKDNPWAAVSGHLCHRPCEVECTAGAAQDPIPIRALKRLAARIVEETGTAPQAPTHTERAERIAVIGGGPAGLTAARDLRLYGYGVTVFEAADQLGGLLAGAIPERRLPRWALDADLAYLRAHGFEVHTGTRLSGEDLEPLLAKGYAGVVIASGAGAPRYGLAQEPGETPGYTHALSCLRRMAQGEPRPALSRVVVLGAGPMGLNAATGLAAAGVPHVTVVHHRGPQSLPADPEALAAASRAGVVLRCGLRAESLVRQGKRVLGIRLRSQTEGEPRRAGRLELRDGPLQELRADLVVEARDRGPEGPGFADVLDTTALGALRVHPDTLQSSHPRVWVAGEAAVGARSLIEAVAMGRRAAAAVHATLCDTPLRVPGWQGQGGWRLSPPAPTRPLRDRRPFADERPGELEPVGLEAARRCLRCGPCTDCRTCSPYCPETHAVDRDGTWVRLPRDAPDTEPLLLQVTRAVVRPEWCRGCGLCEEHCPYSAPRVVPRRDHKGGMTLVAQVNPAACRGCGVCVSVCPTGAMNQPGFQNQQLTAAIDAACAEPDGGTP